MTRLEMLGPAPTLQPVCEAHVWLAGPAISDAAIREGRPTLSPGERDRAERFVFARDRRAYEAAHIVVRQVLSRYLGSPPGDIVFGADEGGKPRIVGDSGGIEFNLSHSGGYVLVGVRRGAPIGVDVEVIRPVDDVAALARHTFAPAEVDALERLPPHQQTDGFFNAWTRKEAYVKATGAGLAAPLDRFVVTLALDAPARIVSIDGSRDAAAGWTLHAFAAVPGVAAAIAAPGALDTVRAGWCVEARRMHMSV